MYFKALDFIFQIEKIYILYKAFLLQIKVSNSV